MNEQIVTNKAILIPKGTAVVIIGVNEDGTKSNVLVNLQQEMLVETNGQEFTVKQPLELPWYIVATIGFFAAYVISYAVFPFLQWAFSFF